MLTQASDLSSPADKLDDRQPDAAQDALATGRTPRLCTAGLAVSLFLGQATAHAKS
jgi:hypothetical protein